MRLARFLVPLTAFAALAVFAGYETDPAGAAETGYLALLVAAALLTVGALAPPPALELSCGAVLATAAVWAFPQGPGRGAVVVALSAALFAIAAARAVAADRALSFATTVPLAVGLQILLRGELLFAPDLSWRRLFALLVLPVAAAGAVALLARRHQASLPLLAGATAALLGPGFDVASTLGLLGLAAGELLATGSLAARLAAGAVLALALVWEPGPGAAVVLCALALWRPRLALVLAVPVAVALLVMFAESAESDWRHVLWLPLLVPAALLPDRNRWASLATGAILAAAVPWRPDMAVLAAPLALVALSLPETGPARLVQAVWTGTLLGGTALLASYPWLRPEPLVATLSWFGLAPRLLPALGCAAALLALTAVGRRLRPAWMGPLTGAALVAAAATHLPLPGEALIPVEMPVVLDAARPAWEAQAGGARTRGLTLESSLANSASLPAGSAVARVRLVTAGGETIERVLRAGEETGEWAARRPDLAHPAKILAPPPRAWISWVAGDFFAQRYRCRFDLNGTQRIASLSVERLADLPADVTIALHGAELAR